MNPRNALLALTLTALLPATAQAEHLHVEKWYQDKWCAAHGGFVPKQIVNHRVPDCIVPGLVVAEFDFAGKYREGVVQADEYRRDTGLSGVLVLIAEHPEKEQHFIDSANEFIGLHRVPIRVEVMGP